MSAWRLLLTRPAEECSALARTLAEQGVFSSSLPLLETEPLALTPAQLGQVQALDQYSAIIVVSKPAARLALEQLNAHWPQPPAQAWFTVGAATAQILDDHGLNVSYPAQGDDSEALLQLPALTAAIKRPQSRVLIIRGEGGRELLAERLAALGARVDYLELYRRYLPHYPEATLVRCIAGERLNGLVVSSGQGFQHLRQLAGEHWPQLAQLPLFVPSPRVAELARASGAQNVVDCRGASAAALLATLQETPAPAP
ncbi:uroporphyrinogen-III synthase [Pseudomonas sp. B21-032]|uniref:uroporphyrinogen-III synthase n=1 Tax=Pseudomonas TaxID=286 RepID=UPI0008825C65|nr:MULTISPECIES: uroporphyrinogen-III synthase [unclassified Pseudomonas]UVL61516.1 uroporphyrinogen-III synthase [Pseudomonas sp. B21-032]SDQ28169.1 uroporphyrinogen-III synthase [Pseudomonas sp. UC 17F4]